MKTFYKLKSLSGLCMLVSALLLTTSTQAQIFLNPNECDTFFAPYGDTLTATGVYTGTMNGTVYTVDLTIRISSSSTQNVNACDSYTAADGTVYTTDTTGATATVLNAVGCDSVITYNIDISTGVTNVPGGVDTSACDAFEAPSGAVYTTSGAFLDTVAGVDGCPVVTTYNLTITGVTNSGLATEVSCGPYTAASGNVYDSTGIYIDTIVGGNMSGCDSIVTIDLTVNSGDEETWTTNAISACDSYTMPGSGTTYTLAANPNGITDMDTIVTIGAAANGCNTIEYNTFTLDWLGNATSSDSTVTSCGSFTWGDSTWTATGTYPYPAGSNAVGCDSTVNVILTIEEFANGGSGVADSSAANGNNITIGVTGYINWNTCGPVTVASGALVDSTALANFAAANPNPGAWYMDTVVDAAGCKTLYDYEINLAANGTTNPDIFVTVTNPCDSWTDENGTVYTANGLYTYVRANPNNGCDQTVNVTISGILSSTAGSIDVNACNDFTWNGVIYDSTGSYTQTFTNAAGCDSVHTLNLTISSVSTSMFMSLAPCDSYTMQNGVVVNTAGVYTDVFVAANGCDSTVILTITMQSSATGTATFYGCPDYTYGDSTYTANAVVEDTLVAANGCDSIVTVTIDIGTATAPSTATASACNSYTAGDGTVYTSSGTFTDNATNIWGCDSIVLVTLTVYNTNASIDEIACGTEYVTPTNDTLTTAGVYVDTLAGAGANGCDSIVTINLTFGANSSTQDHTECDAAYTWNGVTYTVDGTYDWTGTNAAGCDSVATLNLTFADHSPLTTETVTSAGPWTDPNGDVFDADTVITYELTNAAGCDSMVVVVLTVTPIVNDINETLSNVNIYPNPTSGNVTVDLGELTNANIRVANLIGEVVHEAYRVSTPTYNFAILEAAGIYFVEISNENNKEVFKLLVE